MDISTLSLIELKAHAYDQLCQVEQCQRNIDIINKAIAQKSSVEPAISDIKALETE